GGQPPLHGRAHLAHPERRPKHARLRHRARAARTQRARRVSRGQAVIPDESRSVLPGMDGDVYTLRHTWTLEGPGATAGYRTALCSDTRTLTLARSSCRAQAAVMSFPPQPRLRHSIKACSATAASGIGTPNSLARSVARPRSLRASARAKRGVSHWPC